LWKVSRFNVQRQPQNYWLSCTWNLQNMGWMSFNVSCIFKLLLVWKIWWINQHPFKRWEGFILYFKEDGIVKQMVIKVLCASIIDVKTSLFKMTMISSTKVALGLFNIINPLIKMWKTSLMLPSYFCNAMEYVKLVKIAMIQMLSSMEAL